MQVKSFLLYGFIIALACWLIGFCAFGLYAYLMKYAAVPQAQAIVVLTGGAERLQTALELLEQQKAPRMLISGVNSRVSTKDLLQKLDKEYLPLIELGYSAENTYGNALETKKWLKENHIQSILLVTSFYHIPRSLFEMRAQLPNTEIYPVPVFAGRSSEWPRTRSAWLVFVEYNKFIIRFVQYYIRRLLI